VKRAVPLLFCLFLSCGEKKYTPQECQSRELTLVQRCYGGNLQSGKYVGDLKCWPFSKPQRMSGVWVFGLEASHFYPNANSAPSQRAYTWLQTDMSQLRQVTASSQRSGWVAYQVDFVGRQSLCNNNYGQGGQFPHEVVAERFYSLRRLPPR
jgi:hypothetical protein